MDHTTTECTDTTTSTSPFASDRTVRTLLQVFGENMRQERQRYGMGLRELENWCRHRGLPLTAEQINRIELGTQTSLSFDTVVRFALIWEMPLVDLLAGDGDVDLEGWLQLPRARLRELLSDPDGDPDLPTPPSAPSSATYPTPSEPPTPQPAWSRDWTRLREHVAEAHPALLLWTGLLDGGPVRAHAASTGEHPLTMQQFLTGAVGLGVTVVYGQILDQATPHQPHPDPDSDRTIEAPAAVLVLQYPAPGGVVHTWTGEPPR